MKGLALLIGACVLALGACSGGNGNDAAHTRHRTLVVNDTPTDICVAIAATLAEKIAGLANRPSIPAKEGMAFFFDDADTRSFTMRDTAVPLEIVWVAPEDKVLGSTSLTPNDEDPKASPGPIVLAVELKPEDWSPHAATAKTLTLGQSCDGKITAGRPGVPPAQF